jgi:hypothetical protein
MRFFLILLFLLVSPAYSTPVSEIPYYNKNVYKPGWEERGEEWALWLSPSVMVTNERGGGGSGTMCYYDGEYVYIISCGHLYNQGRNSYEYYKKNPHYKNITVFYQNGKKLENEKKFKAETLCHVWKEPYDVSLLRFKPDWENPWVAPIAPVNYVLLKNNFYHSAGCDGLYPVAHYLVKYQREDIFDSISEIITVENGPRGGRSGGGVFDDEGQLLFICSRGSGSYAYWTSLKQIHKFLQEEKFEFVLQNSMVSRTLPIIDRNGNSKEYPKNFIPLPNGR